MKGRKKVSPVAAAGSGELQEDMDEQMRLTPSTKT